MNLKNGTVKIINSPDEPMEFKSWSEYSAWFAENYPELLDRIDTDTVECEQ